MQIQYLSDPVEGLSFHILVVEARGPVDIKFYLDDKLIHTVKCPDPPCHEMTMIPIASAGLFLRIVALDAEGTKEEQRVQIKPRNLPPTDLSTLGGPKSPVNNPVTSH